MDAVNCPLATRIDLFTANRDSPQSASPTRQHHPGGSETRACAFYHREGPRSRSITWRTGCNMPGWH